MDVYQIVTERITAALEAGTVPWQRPWAAAGGLPRNFYTGNTYRGMNVVLLGLAPYASQWWLTFDQARRLNGNVKRGEKSSLVTFWKLDEHDREEDPDAAAQRRRAPLLRYYHVFNVEQCEGIEAPVPDFTPRDHERIRICEEVVAGMPGPPTLGRDPREAFYSPKLDLVAIPDLCLFESAESYYGTLFHELIHSTGHASRLARPSLSAVPSPFGSPDYSQEELLAEFGSAFLCGHCGIFPRTAENHAAYIDGWVSALKGDKWLLPLAASRAQKAADYILNAPSP